MRIRRYDMKNVIVVLALIALLLLAGCGKPEGPAAITSAEELAGVWHRTTLTDFGAEVYRQYTEDGIYRMGNSLAELEAQPRVEGRFWFEGGQIVVQDTAGTPSYDMCVGGEKTGRYDLEVLENGHIRFVLIEDECTARGEMLGSGEMERVE
jgi:predicted small lipoprotein YifL